MTATLYRLERFGTDWALSMLAPNLSCAGYIAFAVLDVGGPLLAAYRRDGSLELFRVTETTPFIEPLGAVQIGAEWEQLHGLTISNSAYLMAYRPHGDKATDFGSFAFFSLDPSMQVSKPLLYSRSHKPCPTTGFSMVRPFVVDDAVVFMGYNFDTGAVCMYSLSAAVSSQGGVPPLRPGTLWDHDWAPGWTRFAFFNLGGEVFFLKTNVKFPNVNIDHVLDSPANGTTEVKSHMHLDDALQLSFVTPFAAEYGHPHFLAYRSDGRCTAYRVHSDCQGWTRLFDTDLSPNLLAIVPISSAENQFFLCVPQG